jgi:hypothetical protein
MPVSNTENTSGRVGQSAPVANRTLSPTFMKQIANKIDVGSLSTFCAFPSGTNFSGQDDDEQVVLIVRQHPVVFLSQFLSIAAFIILAFILPGAVKNLGLSVGMSLAISTGLFIMLMLGAYTLSFDTFVRWYFGVNIITNKRIIDVDYTNVMSHKFSETRLEHIEDVTHKVEGILGMIFNYGTVYVQTAGSVNEFEFDNVTTPNIVQDTLMDLLELDEDIHGR